MATVLTIDPKLWLRTNANPDAMSRVCNAFATTGGNTQLEVPTSDSVRADPDLIEHGAAQLDAAINATSGDLIVLGWSLGAQVAGEWLRAHAPTSAVLPARLSFILLANPERGVTRGARPGGRNDHDVDTPTDTGYTVLDVARQGDLHANPQPGTPLMVAGNIHSNYWTVDLNTLDVVSEETVGGTRFVVVP